MNKTEYLTGYPPERYANELRPLVIKRVSDMRELLMNLREKALEMKKDSVAYLKIEERYTEVEKAIKWWEDLLIEER